MGGDAPPPNAQQPYSGPTYYPPDPNSGVPAHPPSNAPYQHYPTPPTGNPQTGAPGYPGAPAPGYVLPPGGPYGAPAPYGAPQAQYAPPPGPQGPGSPHGAPVAYPGYPVQAGSPQGAMPPHQPGEVILPPLKYPPIPPLVRMGPRPGPEAPPHFMGIATETLYYYDENRRVVVSLECEKVEVYYKEAETELNKHKAQQQKDKTAYDNLVKKQKHWAKKLEDLTEGKHLVTNIGKFFLGQKHEENQKAKTSYKLENSKVEEAQRSANLKQLDALIKQHETYVTDMKPLVTQCEQSRKTVTETIETFILDPKVDPNECNMKVQLAALEKHQQEIEGVLKKFQKGQALFEEGQNNLKIADKSISAGINKGTPGQPGYDEKFVTNEFKSAVKSMQTGISKIKEGQAMIGSGPPVTLDVMTPFLDYKSITKDPYNALAQIRTVETQVGIAVNWVSTTANNNIRGDLDSAGREVTNKKSEILTYRRTTLDRAAEMYYTFRGYAAPAPRPGMQYGQPGGSGLVPAMAGMSLQPGYPAPGQAQYAAAYAYPGAAPPAKGKPA